jgi:small subunit ribosomal protein S10
MSLLKNPKIRIRLKAFHPSQLDASAQKIVDTVKRTGALVRGPIPLRTRRHKWTVLTSPVVDKDARDQFQIFEHKRLLDIEGVTSDTMDALKRLELSREVEIQTQIRDE